MLLMPFLNMEDKHFVNFGLLSFSNVSVLNKIKDWIAVWTINILNKYLVSIWNPTKVLYRVSK